MWTHTETDYCKAILGNVNYNWNWYSQCCLLIYITSHTEGVVWHKGKKSQFPLLPIHFRGENNNNNKHNDLDIFRNKQKSQETIMQKSFFPQLQINEKKLIQYFYLVKHLYVYNRFSCSYEASYAHQGFIYLFKNTIKTVYCEKLFKFKWFSVLIYFI